jgi:hypothetical protein
VQQLHLVGLTADSDKLIFSARKGTKSGGFALPVNEHLLQVIAEAVTRRNADGVELEVPEALQPSASAAPRRQSHLSPREIQDRLRAGRSLEEIAVEAGVGEEWVARFAAPVEAERSQVVGRARRLTYYRPRRGDSGEPLGMAVRWNLADRGVRLANDEFDAAWSAYQLADSAWMVTFEYEARKRAHEAEWEVDLATNELLSRNRLATELGYVEPGRRRRAMASLQPMASASAVRARAAATADGADEAAGSGVAPAKRPAAKRPAAAKRTGASPASSRKAASKRAGAARPAPRKAASARTGATRTAPRKAAAKAGAKRPATRSTAAKRVPAKKTAARASNKKKKTAPVKRTAAASARPTKKAAGRATTRRTGRGVPPGGAPAVPVAAVDDRPIPNELGRRRLQLVAGTGPSTRPSARPGSARPGVPATSGVRIAAARSGDVAAAQRRPPQARPAPVEEIVAPEPGLDVSDSDEAAEARRAERRRARAAARSGEAPAPNAPAARRAAADDDDGRVVTIRANRASPPRGDAELVLPADRPPLRPAQPASQPRKRRFNRTGR